MICIKTDYPCLAWWPRTKEREYDVKNDLVYREPEELVAGILERSKRSSRSWDGSKTLLEKPL